MKYFNIAKIYSELLEIKSLIKVSTAQLLDVDEAARYLKLKKSYIYTLIHRKQIPHYKPNGKRVYFDKLELSNWIINSKIKTNQEIEDDFFSEDSKND